MGQLTVLLVQGAKKREHNMKVCLYFFTAALESLEDTGHQFYLHTMLLVQVFYLFLWLTEVMFTESGKKKEKTLISFGINFKHRYF